MIPAKMILFGDMAVSDPPSTAYYDLKKPRKFIKFKVKPLKLNKFRAKAKLFFDGAYIGKANFQGAWILESMGPLDTPSASFADTVFTPGFLGLVVKEAVSRDETLTITEQEVWRARNIGEVAFRERTRTWKNQVLTSETDWIDAWLIDGSLGGQPIP